MPIPYLTQCLAYKSSVSHIREWSLPVKRAGKILTNHLAEGISGRHSPG